jgi:hypothetical protein
VDRDRLLTGTTYVVLGLLGLAIGVYGAFLIPLRLFGGVEGLADIIGFGGVAAAGVAGAMGLRRGAAAVAPGIGWIVAVAVLGSGHDQDVVIPGSLGNDPGVGKVGAVYLASGLVGMFVAGFVAGRRLRRHDQA